jgi:hypothetical protein
MTGDPAPECLTIRLWPDAKPIGGTVVSSRGETRFTGWIELTALIEAFRSRAAEATTPADRNFVEPPR